jgi:hypothetical protein
MTRIIQIGIRGQLVIYLDNGTIRISNETSCSLLIDGKLVNPGETA